VDIVAQEMKAAMKAKEASKLSTIRMIRTGFQNAAIELKIDTLSDEQVRTKNTTTHGKSRLLASRSGNKNLTQMKMKYNRSMHP
jgi:uncharacterized protein YqeY